MPASQRAAKRAEELGYESLWIADSGGPDPFVVAAAAAAVIDSAAECRDKLEAFRAAGVTTPMVSPIVGEEAAAIAVFEALAPR